MLGKNVTFLGMILSDSFFIVAKSLIYRWNLSKTKGDKSCHRLSMELSDQRRETTQVSLLLMLVLDVIEGFSIL